MCLGRARAYDSTGAVGSATAALIAALAASAVAFRSAAALTAALAATLAAARRAELSAAEAYDNPVDADHKASPSQLSYP